MCTCICVNVCQQCGGAHKGQKEVSDTLEAVTGNCKQPDVVSVRQLSSPQLSGFDTM